MKSLILFLLTLTLCTLLPTTSVLAYNITILQTSHAAPYEEGRHGFLSKMPKSSKLNDEDQHQDNITRFVLNRKRGQELDPAKVAALHAEIRDSDPHLLVAIGPTALREALNFPEYSILHLLAPISLPDKALSMRISGVGMDTAMSAQLDAFTSVLPDIKRLGMIYDPKMTGHMVTEAKACAKSKGIELITHTVNTDKEFFRRLDEMYDKIDAFWMLPDYTYLDRNSFEYLLLFSFGNRVPVLAFAEKYLEMGAAVSVAPVFYELGTQAGAMAREILSGKHPQGTGLVAAESVRVKFNQVIAKKMRLDVNTAYLDKINE